MDNQKYIVMAFFGAAVLMGFAVQGLAVPLLALLEIGDPQILGLINTTSLAGILSGLATFLVLNRHPVVFSFTSECIDELRKVVWPSKDETVRSTMVVVVFTVFVASALAAYDFAWARITGAFLFTEG